MADTLIIVESPHKAKEVGKILGPQFRVTACMGHVMDMPKEYGVDLETFTESYIPKKSERYPNPRIFELQKEAKNFKHVLLASDPDREGEAIAWHLARELKLPMSAPQRIEYNAITEAAIRTAVSNPRPIDMERVEAQRARRILDRIVGYDVSSEICWPAGAQSAGRVQTPALHILCERERAILRFVPVTYWTVTVHYAEGLVAFIPATQEAEGEAGAEVEGAEDAEKETVKKAMPQKFLKKDIAAAAVAEAKQYPHVIQDIATSRERRNPPPVYKTSTLYQDAGAKLKMPLQETVAKAQALFDAGKITYMRTDSTRVAPEAVEMAREYIARTNPKALSDKAPKQRASAGAQDAHEGIRPTALEDEAPFPPETEELYKLIKARFLASQSKPAELERTVIRIQAGKTPFVAEGSVLLDPGFYAFWAPYADQKDNLLPSVASGQTLTPGGYEVPEKKTAPPPRLNETTLVKKLEASGVGRPSTFGPIVATLLFRKYIVKMEGTRGSTPPLQPTSLGMQVDELLTATFPTLVSEEYTRAMEDSLDKIEHGDGLERVEYLREWYAGFRAEMTDALPKAAEYCKLHNLSSGRGKGGGGEVTTMDCDRCGKAKYVKIPLKKGKGSFLACPECKMTRDVRAKIKKGGCTKCGSNLIERKNSKGESFFGCVRFRAEENPCDFIEGKAGAGGAFVRTATDKTCPKCGVRKLISLVPKDATQGKGFYACEERDKCGFRLAIGAKRRKEACPSCGGVVIERSTRDGSKRFWGCARYPDCSYTQELAAEAPGTS